MENRLKEAGKSIDVASKGIDDFTKQMNNFDKTIQDILKTNLKQEDKDKLNLIYEKSKAIFQMGKNGNISGLDIALKNLRKQYGC